MADAACVDDLGAQVCAEEVETAELAQEVGLRVEERAQLRGDVRVARVEGSKGGADFGDGGGFVDIGELVGGREGGILC